MTRKRVPSTARAVVRRLGGRDRGRPGTSASLPPADATPASDTGDQTVEELHRRRRAATRAERDDDIEGALAAWDRVAELAAKVPGREGEEYAQRAAAHRRVLRDGPPPVPDEVADARVVAVVESTATAVAVRWQLRALAPVHVITDRAATELGSGGWPVEQVDDLHGVGGATDEALASHCRELAASVAQHGFPRLPDDLAEDRELTHDVLRYELQTRLLGLLRVSDGVRRSLARVEHDAVVFLGGQGRLGDLLGNELCDRLGAGRVHEAGAHLDDAIEVRTPRPFRTRHTPHPTATPIPPLPKRAEPPAPATTSPTSAPWVLAWPLRNHTLSLVPVLEELSESRQVEVVPLRGRKQDRAHYEPFDDLATARPAIRVRREMLTSPDPDRIAALTEHCAARAPQLAAAVVEAGLPAWSQLPASAVERAVAHVLTEHLPRMTAVVNALGSAYATERPPVVVLTRERGLENRVAGLLARRHGIPSVLVQASLLSPSARHAEVPTEHVTVLDTYARDLHVEHFGADPQRVIPTGFASFDGLRELRRGPPATLDAPRVLLAMQRDRPEVEEPFVAAVVQAVDASATGARLTVKAHPKAARDAPERYQRLLASSEGDHEVATDADVHDLIRRSAVVVSWASTTLVEAAVLGRPAVAVSLDGQEFPLPFVEMGVAHGVSSAAELRLAMAELLRPSELRDDILARQAGYLADNPHLVEPPTAARRIAEVIETLAEGRSPA